MRARTSIFSLFFSAVVVIDPCRVVTQEVHSIRYHLIKASRHAKEKVGATVKRECALKAGNWSFTHNVDVK